MGTLQVLIESIVTDVIQARFQADLLTTELAEHYRTDEAMRQLSVPALNISNLSVELRVAFDDTPIELAEEPSAGQMAALETGADLLRRRVMELTSVTSAVTAPRVRGGISRSLNVAAFNAATESLALRPGERRSAIKSAVNGVLARHKVKLSDADRSALEKELEALESRIASAPKPTPKSVPRVLVGAGTLRDLDANTVSTVRFEIDLAERHWVEVDDGLGGSKTVLTEP